MERLTARDGEFVEWKGRPLYEMGPADIYTMAEHLAAYEDTGLTPEQIFKMYGELCILESALKSYGSHNRMKELVEADKDGRCVVLPCKVGDTIYTHNRVLRTDNAMHDEICTRRIKGYGGNALNKVWLTASGDYCDFSVFPSEFGRTVFLTREEAERAMEGRKDD